MPGDRTSMTTTSRRLIPLAGVALLVGALAGAILLLPGTAGSVAPIVLAPSVPSGSMVYALDNQVILADPDGSDPRPLTADDAENHSPI